MSSSVIDGISSSGELFEKFSIGQLQDIRHNLDNDIIFKKNELNDLITNKYRDLLKVADNITELNDKVREENDLLKKLTFSKSEYVIGDGELIEYSNLIKFNSNLRNLKISNLRFKNKLIVLRNLLDDLENCLETFTTLNNKFNSLINNNNNNDKFSSIGGEENNNNNNNNNNNGNSLSIDELLIDNELPIEISKLIYMIKKFFHKELSKNFFLNSRFNDLVSKNLSIINYQLQNLTIDNENDIILQLLISSIIITMKSPLETLNDFLNMRFIKLSNYNLKNDFKIAINFIFNTINYLNLFNNGKLSNGLIKIIYINNSNINNNKHWIHLSFLQKWLNYFEINENNNIFKIEFPLSKENIKNSITIEIFNNCLKNWKFKISNYLLSNLIIKNNNNFTLNDEINEISKILIGFKNFTSLVLDLKLENNSLLIDNILEKWEKNFIELINNEIKEFNNIKNLIINKHINNGDNNEFENYNKDDKDYLYNSPDDLNNIKIYLDKISKISSNIVGQDKQILIKIEEFYKQINENSQVLIELFKLNQRLLKPILSIDDYEDPQFWSLMSEKIINIYKKILKNCNENIIEIEKNFIDELSNIEIDNTIKIFNLLRCLISLNKKPNLKYLFQDKTLSSSSIDTNKDEVYAALPVHTSTKTVISNGKYSPIITRFLEKLIQLKISSVYDQLEKLINLRFSNLTVEPEEILIWDKLTDGKLIPTQPSYEIVILLYRLSNSLTENNQYNDIFQIEEFKNLKNSISQNLAECILKSIPEEITTNPDSQQILSQKLLLTYADLIYIFSFIYYDRNTTVDEIITKFFTKDEKFKFFLEKATTLQKEDSLLKDNENLRIISKNIIDFYKGNQCLFVF